MKLTIWAELARGGIADYAHNQAEALVDHGVDVEVLCAPAFIDGRTFKYVARPVLNDLRPLGASGTRFTRGLRLVAGLLRNARKVAHELRERPPDALLTHFSEYLSPLWAWRMRALRRAGVRIHTILHDPVRNHVVGPQWWHDLSIRQAYSFLDTVFVHTSEPVPVPSSVTVIRVPHGIHKYPQPTLTREEARKWLDLPRSAVVLTSFGYIRDNKNLDLVLHAIAPLRDTYLVVVGTEQAGGNRPVTYYQHLAQELGCADRCRWIIRFVSAEETANFMAATDVSLLVYSRSFVSSSAALSVGANYKLPCLISSGSQTTRSLIERYRLGVWVASDSAEAIRSGLDQWRRNGLSPDWEGFMREESWDRNAALLVERIFARVS